MPLCTIGYEKRSLDEFIDLLLANGVEVVLDVRETPWSHVGSLNVVTVFL